MQRFIIIIVTISLFIPASCFSQPEEKVEEKSVPPEKKEVIKLPEPEKKGKISLEECIDKRRSTRQFNSRELTSEEISQILWAAQGITGESRGLRAAPSAGALYPLELYVVTQKGVHHYIPEDHKMELYKSGDFRKQLSGAALSQPWVENAPMDLVITAVYQRVTQKYGERGIRYTHMEAGHAAQNIHLQAVALGLGSVPVGAFRDESVKNTLSLPDDHEPLYIIPVGEPEE